MAERLSSGPWVLNAMSNLLAFVLSALMGIAFVIIADKTHDLLSSAAFAEQQSSAQPAPTLPSAGGASRDCAVPEHEARIVAPRH